MTSHAGYRSSSTCALAMAQSLQMDNRQLHGRNFSVVSAEHILLQGASSSLQLTDAQCPDHTNAQCACDF